VRRNNKSGSEESRWLTTKRCTRFVRILIGSFSLAIYCASAPAQLPAGYPAAVNCPPGVNVGLATSLGAPVWSSDLANWTQPLMQNQVETTFAFGECFGGGMLDPLQANAAAAADDFSGTSACQYNQLASYPTAATPTDWVYGYTGYQSGAGPDRADTTAGQAWLGDGYSTAPGNLGWETAQYRDNLNGGPVKLTDVPAANRYAVLWAGQPNMIDWDQLDEEYDTLTSPAFGWKAANIYVLAGAGAFAVPAGLLVGANVQPATAANLQLLLTSPGGLDATLDDNDQFFFMAADHGVVQGLGGAAVVVPRWTPSSTNNPPPYMPSSYPYGSGLSSYGSVGALGAIFDMSDPTNWTVQAQYVSDEIVVPEPSSIALVIIGVTIIAGCRVSRRRTS